MSKILVVVDMQNDFIMGSLGSADAQAIVPKIAEKIKKLGENDGVIFTLDTHNDGYLFTQEGRKLPIQHCIEHSVGWRLHQDLMDAAASILNSASLKKNTFGSVQLFSEICNMYSYCKSQSSEKLEIELVGVCTDICVISNALLLKTYFPEVEISVDANCCAGLTPEKHEAALSVMESCQINVIR